MSDVVDSYELSPMQHGMLFHAVSDRHGGVDIEQIVIALREGLDVLLFMQAWHQVMQRHDILRTRFRWEDVPEPRQEVLAEVELPLICADWSMRAAEQCDRQLATHLAADRRQEFDLAQAPLMRLFIARLVDERHCVVWTFHHALLDGRSFPIVLREVFSLYEAARGGNAVTLAGPAAYREYIDWRRSLDFTQDEAYWRTALRGFHAPTPFGIDSALALDSDTAGESFGAVQGRLPAEITAKIRATAAAAGVTVNTMVQAAWAILLHRYSGECDVVFGATRAGRNIDLSAIDTRIGLFINTLPMRVNVQSGLQIVPWLQSLRAQHNTLRAFEHAPLAAIQSWSEVPRGIPLFESLVVYEHRTLDSQLRGLGGAWQERRCEYIGQTNYPLALLAYGDDEMLLRLEFSRCRYSDAAVARMHGHLTTVLAELAQGEKRHLGDLVLLTPAERSALLGGTAGMPQFESAVPLHERFEQQAARTPHAIALTGYLDERRVEMSYGELNRRANALAHGLREQGVAANELVGLRLERTVEVVIGILAILKAGGAYLPLDPVYPHERIAFMLQDAEVRLVLTQRSLQTDLAELARPGIRLLCVDEPPPAAAPNTNLPPVNTPEDLAYVIYTSGSTGQPKGVCITHRNVARLFAATEAQFGFNARDVWTLFHSYAFDFSVWELWGALLYGARVVVVPTDVSRNTAAFRELLLREGVTVLNQTPTAFRQLIDLDRALPPADFALRYVIFGGEALELHSLKPWFERHGDQHPRLVNMYGITETTVHVTYRALGLADLAAPCGSVIGEPLADLRVYLLDPNGQLVPPGVPAEIYVAGAGVAAGYLKRPELTAQRFLPDPFSAEPHARMYRSGDRARRLDSGELEYLGRIDQQVKIRGFRIELGEIEALIAQHPGVRQVAVIDREDVPGDKRLAAYIVAQPPHGAILEQLRERLHAALPHYMHPAHFVFIQTLPLTANGKLDRRALPAPDDITRPDEIVAPRTPTESLVVVAFAEVLNRRDLGIRQNFFELGGHSLMAARVMAKLRASANVDLPLRNLFERPTPEGLAAAIDAIAWLANSTHADRGDDREEIEL